VAKIEKRKVVTPPPKKIYGRPAVSRSAQETKEAIVDGLFRKRQIHIFGGSSGVGKSRFAIPMLDRIREGAPVFGHESHPTEFVYIAADRDYDTAKALITDLGGNADDWRIFSLLEDAAFQEMEFKRILEHFIIPQNLEARLFFVEGIGMLAEDINDYRTVRKFLHGLLDVCHRRDITIIGSAHSPKMKQGEKYQLTRENILGSVAWGGVADTVLGFDFGNRNDPKDRTRRVVVWPHSFGETEVFHLIFQNDGRLEQVEDPKVVRARNSDKIKDVFWKFVADNPGEFVAADAIDFAEKNGVSRTDTFSVLKAMVEEGRVEKLRRGRYRARKLDALDVTPLD
jgi:AAA domain